MSKKIAVIVGGQGQDGKLLQESLLKKHFEIIGIGREETIYPESLKGPKVNIADQNSVQEFVKQIQPSQLYYLAAYHHSAQDRQDDLISLYEKSDLVHVKGFLHFLQALENTSKSTKTFYASSSLVFGDTSKELLDETTPLNPQCIYGITKVAGMHLAKIFREKGLHVSVGILFNHESHLRADRFLSKKIVQAAIGIKNGNSDKLVLGDLSARVDWSAAEDFVEAFQEMLSLPMGEDFILASGKAHTVEDFARTAFSALDLDFKDWILEKEGILNRRAVTRVGNPEKLYSKTGWRPKISFKTMISRMIEATQISNRLGVQNEL